MNNSTIILGDFESLLSTLDRLAREKINTERLDLNYASDQIDPTDIYRTLYAITAEYMFFSSALRIFSRLDHM